METVLRIVLCISLAGLLLSIILSQTKGKQKLSKGQLLTCIGTSLICIALLLSSFELISHAVYFIIVIVGLILEVLALIQIWKKKK